MKVAIPVDNGTLTGHFGQCRQVAMFTVDQEAGRIEDEQTLDMPAHQPGVFPLWLAEQGADVIIAGGMGPRALMLFDQAGVRVVVGAAAIAARELVEQFLAGQLTAGDNHCSHGPDHQCDH